MQEVSLEVESNLKVVDRLRFKPQYQDIDRKKQKNEVEPSIFGIKFKDHNIDEMTKMIKDLSNKLTKLEVDNKNMNRHAHDIPKTNPNQFCRPFNSQYLW